MMNAEAEAERIRQHVEKLKNQFSIGHHLPQWVVFQAALVELTKGINQEITHEAQYRSSLDVSAAK